MDTSQAGAIRAGRMKTRLQAKLEKNKEMERELQTRGMS